MDDALLKELEKLRDDPIPLLNLPEKDREQWESVLFDLAEMLEDRRILKDGGMLAK